MSATALSRTERRQRGRRLSGGEPNPSFRKRLLEV
jgi:hypothetical protein